MFRPIHLVLFPALILSAAAEEGVAFFRDQVKPILAANCFKCHGGENPRGEIKIRGGLQMISRKGLLLGGEHGPAIDLANPSESLILKALSYEDEEMEMPPRGKLPDAQIELIRQWIEKGAPWTPEDEDRLIEVDDPHAAITEVNEKTRSHWSYRPMQRPPVPEVKDPDWGVHPVDAFLMARLEKHGLQPAAPASRASLLRRASYDLTGLPPTLAEIRAFENDDSPDAWEKQVDRLLASPHYGEKWARHWLDLVRYAESNGFERDAEKPFVWRYRDWVVRSFNEDLPYSRFISEQLAGDELPDRDADSLIATGYHRLMQWDDEPADKVQYPFDVLDDNVRITSEAFMAMTLGCARCHDHKGDPIPQRDYYRFQAFFRGISPISKGEANVVTIDMPDSPGGNQEALAKMREEEESLRGVQASIEKEAVTLAREKHPGLAARLGDKDKARWIVTDARTEPWEWYYTTKQPHPDWSEVSFRAEQHNWQKGPAGFGTSAPGVMAKTEWKSRSIWLQTSFLLEEIPDQLQLHLYHDENVELYLNGQPVVQRQGYTRDYLGIPAPAEFLRHLQTGRNVLAAKVTQTSGGQFFDLGIERDSLTPRSRVLDHHVVSAETIARYQNATKRLATIEKARQAPSGIKALVVAEGGRSVPPTHVHIRGSAHAEGEQVEPGFPAIWGGEKAVIAPLPPEIPSSGRRLALATWLTRPDHPRTARVMVNRIWQHHFGRGLCPTPNDFGYLGTAPTHPELLDWLATEFVRLGWSVKSMHRLLMTSRSYQMSVESSPREMAADPANDHFWRFNPRRLTAEEIRDSILNATGELNRQIGGPSVFIELPEEVIATSSTKAGKWGRSPVDQQNRRSLYVKMKRSLLPPMFSDFDLTDIDNPCPVRFTTTVPTQALAMLHSDFTNQKAVRLADRLRSEHPDDPAAQVRRAFEVLLSRPPSQVELSRSLAFLETLQSEQDLDPTTALNRFALAALNFNEFLFLD
ncbi:MAG: DUF1553 domain-containing protein [Luteolibacter sp.]